MDGESGESKESIENDPTCASLWDGHQFRLKFCSQHMTYTDLQFANSSVNIRIRIYLSRTRRAPTDLLSLQQN